MITATDLEVRAGVRTLLSAPGSALRVQAGDRIGLVGRNGAGKTTTLRILAGEGEPYAGAVVRSGELGYLPQDPKVDRVEVDKGSRDVRAFGKDGKLLAYYPASIGSEEKPAPSGETKVKGVAFDPSYTYDPKYRFKGVKTRKKFSIRPGPNNPVGLVWIDLAIPSYGIHGTPTVLELAARIADLEGAHGTLLVPSGLGAISLVYLALCRAGSHVLIPEHAYAPNRELASGLLARFGIVAESYDPMIRGGIDALIRPETALIWTESPGSITMEVQDVPAICAAARAHG